MHPATNNSAINTLFHDALHLYAEMLKTERSIHDILVVEKSPQGFAVIVYASECAYRFAQQNKTRSYTRAEIWKQLIYNESEERFLRKVRDEIEKSETFKHFTHDERFTLWPMLYMEEFARLVSLDIRSAEMALVGA